MLNLIIHIIGLHLYSLVNKMKRNFLHREQVVLKSILILLSVVCSVLHSAAQVSSGWMHKKELYSLLSTADDSIYIQDRGELEELFGSTCTKNEVRYYSSSKSSELFQISIKTKKFLPSLHIMHLTDTVFVMNRGKKKVDSVIYKNHIDGVHAYGIYAEIPKEEFSTFIILRGYSKISIPKSAYSDLYNIRLCENNKAPEAYVTTDSKYLYLYMHGGEGKNAYAVKFIFDHEKYLTRIVNTHPCLKDFDFLDGFGECE